MSKEKVLQFLDEAAKNEEIKEKLQSVENPSELTDLAKTQGYDFSEENVDEALVHLKENPGFFGKIVEAALEIFSPPHDDYPNIGVEPFTGEPNRSN